MNTEYLFPMLLARKGGGGMPGTNYAVALSVTVEGDQYTFQLMDQNGDPIGDSQTITLPAAMVFRGTVGTGGTISTLPVDGTADIGDTYMVYADGTYASQAAVVGDTFVCLTKTENANTWAYIPSGNDPRVTSVSAGTGLTTSDGNPITSAGTVKAKLQSDTAFGAAAATVSTPGSVTTDIQPVLTDSNGNLAVKVTKSDVGLGNVTNDAQVKKISSSVQNNIVTWGAATGDTVADSGVAIETSSSGISDSDVKVPTSKDVKTNAAGTAVLTGYTSESPAVSDTIVATDTIEGAIAKLDARSRTNTNNISLIQDSVNGREFTFTSGGNIATNVDVGATVDITPNPVGSWSYTVSPCNAGEVITITGQGGSTPRLWAFTDKDYKLISKAADGAGLTGGTVTAPANTAYCIINSTTATLGFCGIKSNTSLFQEHFVFSANSKTYYMQPEQPASPVEGDIWIG